MHGSSRAARVLRYLAIAGGLPRWDVVAYAALAVIGGYCVAVGVAADNAALAMAVIAPVLVGTGVLSGAKEGRLDLLFGSGVRRPRVWMVASARAFLLPLLAIGLCAAVFVRSGGVTAPEAFVRMIVVGAITMGIAFAAGTVQPRFLLGVLWCGRPVGFLVSPPGREIYMQIVHPDVAGKATFLRAVVGIFGFPEILLYARVPLGATALALVLRLVCLIVSFVVFLRTEFGGHRTA